MPLSTSLVAEFRRRIQDVRPSRRAFSISISDPNAIKAVVEVTNGHFIVNVSGGEAPSVDFLLTNPAYDTVGKLYQVLSRTKGYSVQRDEDASHDHLSMDIDAFGPLPINETGLNIAHHVFSDSELEEVLRRATQRHNPSLTPQTVPPQEHQFVHLLGHAEICKIQAYDATKRRGLDKTVDDLLKMSQEFEQQYRDDTERLARAIQSPREANPNTMNEGDVVLGKMVRRSLRTGFQSPLSQVLDPTEVVLLDPDEHDVEDDNVRVVWRRNKDMDFYEYELWMDSQPDVVRTREGGLVFAGTPISFQTTDDVRHEPGSRMTTSTMVFRSFGANSNSSRSSFSTFVEEFGQLIRSFAVGNLESSTTYYWRLYVINNNYVAASSNVVKATTKALRARFMPIARNSNQPGPTGTAFDRVSGPAGTVVNVTLDPTKGQYTAQHVFKVAEKVVVPTINTPYSLTIVIPTFQNIGNKDLVIISPNKLQEVRSQAFMVSAS